MLSNSIGSREFSYTKALIILSDKTTYKICQYIQQNLKLKVKLYDCTEKDIMEVLNNDDHETFDKFIRKYTVEINPNKDFSVINDFKIYIVMNLDEFNNDEQRNKFLDKSMFKDYWAYDYIIPIFNEENLKKIILESNINSEIKIQEKKEYVKIFPLANKFDLNITDRNEIEILKSLIQKNKKTNLNDLLDYCLNI